MVVVRVRHEDRCGAVARKVLQGVRRARVAADERIEQQRRATGRRDLEGRMTEPLDGDLAARTAPIEPGLRRERERGEGEEGQRRGDERTTKRR